MASHHINFKTLILVSGARTTLWRLARPASRRLRLMRVGGIQNGPLFFEASLSVSRIVTGAYSVPASPTNGRPVSSEEALSTYHISHLHISFSLRNLQWKTCQDDGGDGLR